MNLIYQYWEGYLRKDHTLGSEVMKRYAERIGADYIFEHNPDFLRTFFKACIKSRQKAEGGHDEAVAYLGALKPLFAPEYDKYDTILFVDLDVFPSEHLYDSIFDELGDAEIGIVPEFYDHPMGDHLKDRIRDWESRLNRVGIEFSQYNDLPIALNSGVVLYSKQARLRARKENWFDLPHYLELVKGLDPYFFTDQPYLQYMFHNQEVDLKYLDQKWNGHMFTQMRGHEDGTIVEVEHFDRRTPETNFTHFRCERPEQLTNDQILRIVHTNDWPEEFTSGNYLKKIPKNA